MAVTPQVPTDVYDKVVPAIEHPAVPAVVTAYETEPVPDPPVVESAANNVGEETVWPVKIKVDWVAWLIVIDTAMLVVAL